MTDISDAPKARSDRRDKSIAAAPNFDLLAGVSLRLPLRINEQLGAGLVALPKGLAGIPPAIFGASVEGLQEAAQ